MVMMMMMVGMIKDRDCSDDDGDDNADYNADGDDNDQMGLPTESAQVGRLIDWLCLPNLQLSNFSILIPAMHTVHNT